MNEQRHPHSAPDSRHMTRAIKMLEAHHIPGTREYVYFDPGTDAHYVVPANELERLADMLGDGVHDAYSVWCSELVSEEASDSQVLAYERLAIPPGNEFRGWYR